MSNFYNTSSSKWPVAQMSKNEFFNIPTMLNELLSDSVGGQTRFNPHTPALVGYEIDGDGNESTQAVIRNLNDIIGGDVVYTNWEFQVSMITLQRMGIIEIHTPLTKLFVIEVKDRELLTEYGQRYGTIEEFVCKAVPMLEWQAVIMMFRENLWPASKRNGTTRHYNPENLMSIYEVLRRSIVKGYKSLDGSGIAYGRKVGVFDEFQVCGIVRSLSYKTFAKRDLVYLPDVIRVSLSSDHKEWYSTNHDVQVEDMIRALVLDYVGEELRHELCRGCAGHKLSKKAIALTRRGEIKKLMRNLSATDVSINLHSVRVHYRSYNNTRAWYNKLAKLIIEACNH